MQKANNKSYIISSIILSIITFIIFNIMLINEDSSWNIVPFIFTIIVFAFSFPSSIISKKYLNIGNKIERKILRILYYALALPISLIVLFAIVCFIMISINENIETPNELAAALSQALTFLFLVTVAFIAIVLPYFQTLIVLCLNKFMKTKENSK